MAANNDHFMPEDPHLPEGPHMPAARATWRARVADPSLTVLLVMNVIAVFVVSPLAAMGYRLPDVVALVLLAAQIGVVLLVTPSRRAAFAVTASLLLSVTAVIFSRLEASAVAHAWLEAGGQVIGRLTVCWVLFAAVFGPGRITHHRILGAVTLYLNVGLMFAAVYQLIDTLAGDVFISGTKTHLQPFGTMVYFSFTTLTSVGFGDIQPVQPLARSVAILEAILGQMFPATLLARIVTLELTHRTLMTRRTRADED